MNLISFYIIRKNDKKKAWNILRTRNLTPFKNEREFSDDFNRIKHVNDKALEHMADMKARSSIQDSSEDYRELFLAGGIFFQA